MWRSVGDRRSTMNNRVSAPRVALRLRRWLPRALGLALSGFAIWKVGRHAVWSAMRHANPWLILIAAVAVFPLLAPKARRWQEILHDFGIDLSWRESFRFYSIGLWAAIATPGQVGDALKAWYVQGRGGHLAPALASVVVDRLFDLLMLLLAASFGIFVYGSGAQVGIVGLLTVVTLGGIALVARPALRRAVGRMLPAKPRDTIASHRWAVALRGAHLSGRRIVAAFGWSLISFGATVIRIALCFRALDIRLPVATMIAVVGLSSLAGLLSVSGIGTRDVALIALLGRDGIGHETALAASFLILLLNLTNVVPGFAAWLRDPVPLKPPPAPRADGERPALSAAMVGSDD